MLALDLCPFPGSRFRKGVSDKLRFLSRVSRREGCWEWEGTAPDGYGRIRIDGVYQAAHRVAYEWEVGPVPPGMVLDHLCLNRACVRPDHLEVVTPRENSRRGMKKKDTCVGGHDLTVDGAQFKNRSCKQCASERQRLRSGRSL